MSCVCVRAGQPPRRSRVKAATLARSRTGRVVPINVREAGWFGLLVFLLETVVMVIWLSSSSFHCAVFVWLLALSRFEKVCSPSDSALVYSAGTVTLTVHCVSEPRVKCIRVVLIVIK